MNKKLSEMTLEELNKFEKKESKKVRNYFFVWMTLLYVLMFFLIYNPSLQGNWDKNIVTIIGYLYVGLIFTLLIKNKFLSKKINLIKEEKGWINKETEDKNNKTEFDQKLEELKNMESEEFKKYKEKTFSQREILKPIIAWVIINVLAYFALNLDTRMIEATLDMSSTEAYSKFFYGSLIVLVIFLLVIFVLKQSFSQNLIEKYQELSEKLDK